jgi:Flp pilus assembly protein TadD
MKTESDLMHIYKLIDDNQCQEALQMITRIKSRTDPVLNAQGVCLMRLGQIKDAVRVLRALAFNGLPAIPSERPAVIQANYATALLLAGDNTQAIDILRHLDESQTPYVAKIKHTVKNMKKGLGLGGRILWAMTLYPKTQIQLDDAPGALL